MRRELIETHFLEDHEVVHGQTMMDEIEARFPYPVQPVVEGKVVLVFTPGRRCPCRHCYDLHCELAGQGPLQAPLRKQTKCPSCYQADCPQGDHHDDPCVLDVYREQVMSRVLQRVDEAKQAM